MRFAAFSYRNFFMKKYLRRSSILENLRAYTMKARVMQEKPCNLIDSGILLKHRNTNFTFVEATLFERNGTPKGFLLHIHTYFRMTVSEEESTSLSVKIFEELDNRNAQTMFSTCYCFERTYRYLDRKKKQKTKIA